MLCTAQRKGSCCEAKMVDQIFNYSFLQLSACTSKVDV